MTESIIPFEEPLPRPTKINAGLSEMYAISMRRIKRENNITKELDLWIHPEVVALQKWLRERLGDAMAWDIMNENL